MTKILHIDTSAIKTGSNSRALSKAIVEQLKANSVTYRDVSVALPIVDEAFISANFTPKEERTAAQKARLNLSDELIQELRDHDIIVLGVPMYNFNIPASLKLYQDIVARVGETFIYTETGPKGLLENKKIYFALTSGGVPLNVGVESDHLSASLKSFFSFVGIIEQYFIVADGLAANAESSLKKAYTAIAELT